MIQDQLQTLSSNNDIGWEYILRGKIRKPENDNGRFSTFITYRPSTHPLLLKPLRRSQQLISTVRDEGQWLDADWKQEEEKQIELMAKYIRDYFVSTEAPRMRLSEKVGRGVYFEISFFRAPHTLISGAIVKKRYQKVFQEMFQTLDRRFGFGNIRNTTKRTFWE